jgi:outer membrane protein assembly factor BamE
MARGAARIARLRVESGARSANLADPPNLERQYTVMKLKFIALFAVLVTLLGGCSIIDWMTYKLPVSQGNIVEQKDVDKLRPGMNPEQVVYVLGEPLAKSSFEGTRWEYSFRSIRGSSKLSDTRFAVFFKDGLLVAAAGDFTLPEGLEKREI